LPYKEINKLTSQQAANHFCIFLRILFRWNKSIVPCITRNKLATKVGMEVLLDDIEKHPEANDFI